MEYLKNYYGDKFSQIFKTITSDNGSEFAELAKLEDNTKTKYTLPTLTVHGKEVLTNVTMVF